MSNVAGGWCTTAVFAACFSLASGRPAVADPIDLANVPIAISYSVSGSAGNWLLDFSVRNRFPVSANPDMGIYMFGALLPGANMQTASAGAFVPWTFARGVGLVPENNIWLVPLVHTNMPNPLFIQPGQMESGFLALDQSATAPTDVPWFASAYSQSRTAYEGRSDFGAPMTPGFFSTSEAQKTVTPEPASMLLLGTGVAGRSPRVVVCGAPTYR